MQDITDPLDNAKRSDGRATGGQASWIARAARRTSTAAVIIGPILSGVVLGTALSVPAMRALVWVALVPFAWSLVASRQRAFYGSVFLGAVVCHLMALDFVRQAYAGTVASAWITLSVLASIAWVVAAAAGRAVRSRFDLPMSVLLPLLWIAMEFARMYFMALFAGFPFPYAQLGTTIVEYRHLVQVADIGGVWALTWLVVAVNGAVFDIVCTIHARGNNGTSPRRAVLGVGAASVVLAAAWLYGVWRLSQPPSQTGPIVALVSGSLREAMDSKDRERLTERIQQAVGDTWPALFVWSEGACPWPIITQSSPKNGAWALISEPASVAPGAADGIELLRNLSRQLNAAVLTGCDRHEIAAGNPIMRCYNSVAVSSAAGEFQGCYDKMYLVPWSEFQPRVALSLGLLPAPPRHPDYRGPFRPGSRCATFTLVDGNERYTIASSICFEVSYATLHRRLAANFGSAPAFFVGVASEGAFEGPLYAQVSADAQRVRAVECRRAFARIARHGISGFVDGNGQIVAARFTTDNFQVLSSTIPIDDRFSPYVLLGDWLPISSCVVVALLAGSAIHRNVRLRRQLRKAAKHAVDAAKPC